MFFLFSSQPLRTLAQNMNSTKKRACEFEACMMKNHALVAKRFAYCKTLYLLGLDQIRCVNEWPYCDFY